MLNSSWISLAYIFGAINLSTTHCRIFYGNSTGNSGMLSLTSKVVYFESGRHKLDYRNAGKWDGWRKNIEISGVCGRVALKLLLKTFLTSKKFHYIKSFKFLIDIYTMTKKMCWQDVMQLAISFLSWIKLPLSTIINCNHTRTNKSACVD